MSKTTAMDPNTTRIILESISDGVFTVNHNWVITSFNHAAEEITGVSRDEAIGRHCWEVFRSNMCEADCALKRTMAENKPFASTSAYIINSQKKRIPITVSTSPLIDAGGEVLGGVETFRDLTLVEELRNALSAKFRVDDMVSSSSAMKTIFDILPKVAESDSTVLIEGETGTGKELAARAIHNASHRGGRPFVAINCGALPDTLLESELFGYKAGAFTHAVKDKPGHFAMAEGGTVFLDEIGDTSPAFQVKLLRFLEERKFLPLGGVRQIAVDVRIVAATNRKLSVLVKEGAFREDLYYRINVVRLKMPPLRERMEDIPVLAAHFIRKFNKIKGKAVCGLNREALGRLMSHDFPGNIRELENIMEYAFVLCSEGDIGVSQLPGYLALQSPGGDSGDHPGGYSGEYPDEYPGVAEGGGGHDPVKAAEIKVIMDALERNGYNRKAAAKDLGIHKSTLFRKINKLGINLPKNARSV